MVGDDRCFYDLNICEHSFKESPSRLNRYLGYNKIVDNVGAFKEELKRDCEKSIY